MNPKLIIAGLLLVVYGVIGVVVYFTRKRSEISRALIKIVAFVCWPWGEVMALGFSLIFFVAGTSLILKGTGLFPE